MTDWLVTLVAIRIRSNSPHSWRGAAARRSVQCGPFAMRPESWPLHRSAGDVPERRSTARLSSVRSGREERSLEPRPPIGRISAMQANRCRSPASRHQMRARIPRIEIRSGREGRRPTIDSPKSRAVWLTVEGGPSSIAPLSRRPSEYHEIFKNRVNDACSARRRKSNSVQSCSSASGLTYARYFWRRVARCSPWLIHASSAGEIEFHLGS